MPLREWAKKHIKKDSEEKNTDYERPPSFQIYRSDTKEITPLHIPDGPAIYQSGSLSAQSLSSPNKTKRFSLLGVRARSSSQNSLPDWTPPDESDPNAERDWEQRATRLAKLRPTSLTSSQEELASLAKLSINEKPVAAQSLDGHLLPQVQNSVPTGMIRGISSEDALQEAIQLHEDGSEFPCSGYLIYRIGGSNNAFQRNCGATRGG